MHGIIFHINGEGTDVLWQVKNLGGYLAAFGEALMIAKHLSVPILEGGQCEKHTRGQRRMRRRRVLPLEGRVPGRLTRGFFDALKRRGHAERARMNSSVRKQLARRPAALIRLAPCARRPRQQRTRAGRERRGWRQGFPHPQCGLRPRPIFHLHRRFGNAWAGHHRGF